MKKRLLICDFDNTLYDWVSYFVPSFYNMVAEAATILECDQPELLDDLRSVHQKFRDSEHPFALLETDVVRGRYPHLTKETVARLLDAAFYAFNKTRKQTLHLYPNVFGTLSLLQGEGIKLVGHTEAKFLAVVDRLSRLDLGQFFSTVYCRERSPSSRPNDETVYRPSPNIGTRIVELSHHQAKPSAEVLTEICTREGFSLDEVAYVGDSLFKDILMANRASVHAIWAKYGTVAYHDCYEKLVRVSHWREEDIAFERSLRTHADEIRPDFTLEHCFDEILFDESLGIRPSRAVRS